MPTPVRLLLIDDDRGLCELLAEYLCGTGFEVDAVHDGDAGVARALAGAYAIAVLDVMLPGGDGFEVLRRIRARSRIPVLMLTARGEEVDRIVGLEIGADDYLPKPFNPRELAARLHAILRRSGASSSRDDPAPSAERIAVEDVELDSAARSVRCGGRLIELTGAEFGLLELLLRSAGRVVSREELSSRVLGRRAQPFDRSVDMHVSKIRRKLGRRPDSGERIRSIRGAGYIFVVGGGPAPASPNGE
ncbi:MAG: Transcriptional regulatory protein CpxR [Phycisphaerae bacterium]|nr:Transcriptional regulatory protein CpxR [Phycisphaerae bacterium]